MSKLQNKHAMLFVSLIVCNLMLQGFINAEDESPPERVQKAASRPYELVRAGRDKDAHPPLCDFEDLSAWRMETENAEAVFEATTEQQLWGEHTCKLTYRATGPKPRITITPPRPIAIDTPFDAVTLWVYGNNWFGHTNWGRRTAVPKVQMTAFFSDAEGKPFHVDFMRVRWKCWFLCHQRLSSALERRIKNGATFNSLLFTNGTNRKPLSLYLDNLAVFTEKFAPLKFTPRRKPAVSLFKGQHIGTHTGRGTLPFPTREETILPENLTSRFTTSIKQRNNTFVFTYTGDDGTLTYQLTPETGTWSDISAHWKNRGGPVHPCMEGGVYLEASGKARLPEKRKHVKTTQEGDTVISRWHLSCGTVSTDVTYRYRLWNKSLVIDTITSNGKAAEVRYGCARGLASPKLVTNPYYTGNGTRPAVAVATPGGKPLFLTGNTDWYRSNASAVFFENRIQGGCVYYNGGTRYKARTDGTRNRCCERFFLTLSPRYEEMLPVVANPPSKWKHITGTHIWRAHGAGNRGSDRRYWKLRHRYGMRSIVVTDHETMWRDSGESFTFRTKAAPGKGGDKGAYDYARFMQDTLGFVYGPYNNFTDFAPVNEYWHTDMVNRLPDKQLQHAWTRCYAPKPSRAVEYCEKLAPRIEKKFRFSTAYCDVHTAVRPWDRVDYDARVPGAGTFTATYYAYGEIMLIQKRAWKGPVYSEGNNHFMYCGLTDGNYAQDQVYRIPENPWLVDFDLRRLHDLCCNFGMGNPGMFFPRSHHYGKTRREVNRAIDRFLAATVAFGHPGFLISRGGFHNTLKSYYMLQQLQSRYTLSAVDSIRYADEKGNLHPTSDAVAAGIYRRNQIITRYKSGCITAVNGNKKETMNITAFGRSLSLPPNGYAGWTEDGTVDVVSSRCKGNRFDYADTPAYIFINGREAFCRAPKAAGKGLSICRKTGAGTWEVIYYNSAEAGFAVNGIHAEALDKAGNRTGEAEIRNSRGLTWIMPEPEAFSYLLTTGKETLPPLSCKRKNVIAGETVIVKGKKKHEVAIPASAQAGDRIWRRFENRWIDFTVTELSDTKATLHGNVLTLELSSNLSGPEQFSVNAAGREKTMRITPGARSPVRFSLGEPEHEETATVPVVIKAAGFTRTLNIHTVVKKEYIQPVDFPDTKHTGTALRNKNETFSFGATRGYVRKGTRTCGGIKKSGFLMHPPYMGGVGYAFLVSAPVTLPGAPPLFFRASVGKGDGSDPGDGILYKAYVVDASGKETMIGEKTVRKHLWKPVEGDLSRWAGHSIQIKLVSDVGRADNSTGDWAAWAGMRIQSSVKMVNRRLKTE